LLARLYLILQQFNASFYIDGKSACIHSLYILLINESPIGLEVSEEILSSKKLKEARLEKLNKPR